MTMPGSSIRTGHRIAPEIRRTVGGLPYPVQRLLRSARSLVLRLVAPYSSSGGCRYLGPFLHRGGSLQPMRLAAPYARSVPDTA
eukprot:3595124-Rhodomonas_salina.1